MEVVTKSRGFLYRLMEELQGRGPFQLGWGTRKPRHRKIGNGAVRTLCQVQDKISADGESRFVELFHAPVYYIGITMNEKDAKGTPPVRGRASRAERAPSRLEISFCARFDMAAHTCTTEAVHRYADERLGGRTPSYSPYADMKSVCTVF